MKIVLTEDDLEEAVETYRHVPALAFDTETRGDYPLDPRRNDLFWISFASTDACHVIPMGHPNGKLLRPAGVKEKYKVENPRTGRLITKQRTLPVLFSYPPEQLSRERVLDAFKPVLFDKDIIKVGHNLKFDVETVGKYYGAPPVGPYEDTSVMAFLLNENRRQGKHGKPYSLGNLVYVYFKYEYDKTVGKSVSIHPFKKAATYSGLDARYTWLLRERLLPMLHDAGLWELFHDVEMRILSVLVDMETEGATVDIDALQALDEELGSMLLDLQHQVWEEVGHEFNLNSNPQKQKIFYEERGLRPRIFTDSGAPSTAADALEYYRETDKAVALYLEHAEVTKLRSYPKSYLYGNAKKKTPPGIIDGKIHANFKQTGAVTGRFSCSEPNLQNIPRAETELGKKIRSVFVAPSLPDYMLIGADYQQIEYVVLAHYSNDPTLKKFFMDGVDFHMAIASMLLGKPIDQVTKVERTVSKNTNFATVYGAGDDKVAAMSGVSLQQARRFRNLHREMLPKVYLFTDSVVRTCRQRKPPHVKTLLGRKRRLPEIMSRDYKVRGRAERQAVNTVIQGSAADIIKVAMLRLHESLQTELPQAKMILSVHDELVTVCPTPLVEEGVRLVTEAMQGIDLLSVPLRADVKVAERWSDAK